MSPKLLKLLVKLRIVGEVVPYVEPPAKIPTTPKIHHSVTPDGSDIKEWLETNYINYALKN